MKHINEAIKERDEYLKKHPRLLDFQIFINKQLEGKTNVQRQKTLLRLMLLSTEDLTTKVISFNNRFRSSNEDINN